MLKAGTVRFVAIIAGVVFGGLWAQSLFGAAVGGLLAWLARRSLQQDQRIAGLQQALQALQTAWQPQAVEPARAAAEAVAFKRGEPVSEPVSEPVAEPITEPVTEAVTEAVGELKAEAPSAEAAQPFSGAAAPEPVAPGRARQPEPAQPSAPSFITRARNWFLGGNTIAKAGVGILFIGLAFLAKYASEHAQVPVEVRLAGIAAVALVLLGLGWRLRGKRPAYAQALQGGAVAVLYLTLFVAFRGYGVLSAGPVFVLMVLVAALAAALAVLQDARTLALIGALGGFATPLLVSTGSGNEVALFTYYLVLDLGIAAVAWFKTWRLLNLVGFVFTFAVGSTWGVLQYSPTHYATSQAFLVAYFLLFNAVLVMPARRLQAATGLASKTDRWVNGSLLFGLPTITFVLQHGLVRHWAYGTALSALVLAGFYVVLATRMKKQPQGAVAFEGTLAVATVFLILVVPFALNAHSTAGAWALEGAGLVWLGLRQQRRLPRLLGYVLFPLAGGAMLLASIFQPTPSHWFNALAMNSVLMAAAALAAGCFVQRKRALGLMRFEGMAESLLIVWATLWLLLALHTQIDIFVPAPYASAAWLAGLSVMAVVYAMLSLRLRWHNLGVPLAAHAPLLMLFAAAEAATLHNPLADGGVWAWPLALTTHGLLLAHLAPTWAAPAPAATHALGALVVATLGALLGRTLTAGWGGAGSAWPWLGALAVPALLLLLLPHPATAARWPVRLAPAAYQAGAGAVLTVALLLWSLLANAGSDGSASPLPHVPLLNPLDLGVATALLAAWRWLRCPAAADSLAAQRQLPAVLLGGAGFVWLNAMLVRGFHHYGGVPYRLDEWINSLAVQTGLTLLWSATALALMWLSARRLLRTPWMVGAALLAAVVAKLLLVDLSGSGTVTRIVSFIGVGLLMLVIAYVAPLPSSEARRDAA